ncbi:MAG: single-stranded DNA-binding protein [Polyangiales bacterium]
MADGLNKVMLIGNLGQDPELRYLPSGQGLLTLRIATNESFINREGERQEKTEWHSVTVWGKRGEALSKILSKGRQIFVEGRLQTRSWEDKQGNKRYTTEVVATEIVLLGGGGRGAGPKTSYEDAPPSQDESGSDEGGGGGRGGGARGGGGGGGGESHDDDDIPF